MNDLRFACRQLLQNPGFKAVALLLKPLPWAQPGFSRDLLDWQPETN